MPAKRTAPRHFAAAAPEVKVDAPAAIQTLLELLGIQGLSGQEGNVDAAIVKMLLKAGVKKSQIRHDGVHKKVPFPAQVGNLIVDLPGTVAGPRRLFMGHMDTVPLCAGAVPVRRGGRIVAKGATALGADNRTACGTLVTCIRTLLKCKLPHPPLTFLFTIAEETGLWGARLVDANDLRRPAAGFNFDGGDPADAILGATGAERWEVEVLGISSHAGVHPENGVSAIAIAALAIGEVWETGWFGRVIKGKHRGTSNVGRIQGGMANNQVADRVSITGESRSHEPPFAARITAAYRHAFVKAAASVRSIGGKAGKIKFTSRVDYPPFRMDEKSPAVQMSAAAIAAIGLKPTFRVSNGGLDANYINKAGIPTVTFGAGQHNPHTIEEYADLSEYIDGCRLAVALATMQAGG
ncbi:MAG: M20/M25/M40 family metallo-hydrolase [Planctomycetota bacterium]